MSRPLRIEFPGALYHVMARGNARQAIVFDDRDRRALLANLARVSTRFQWRLWAYCLMNNHYHVLLQTSRPHLSLGMRELNGIYAQNFNRRHGRVGHVFQGRYRALLVDRDSYLLEVSRYIMLNPVRARLCRNVDDWKWSSYRAIMGRALAPAELEVDAILERFANDRQVARRAFGRFVAEGLGAHAPPDRLQLYVGDDPFVERMAARVRRASSEIPRSQRSTWTLARHAREARDRDDAIRAAYASGTYSLVEIGRYFGLHYATVSRIVRAGDRQYKT